MRVKPWIKYAIYILLICIVLFLKDYVVGKIEYSFQRTFGANGSYILLITIPFIFNLAIGFLIGIENFINEINKDGKWRINLPKIILVGVPSLFFSLTYHFASINNFFVQHYLLKYTTLGTNFIPVFQILLGYVFITCLYKYNVREIE